MIKQLFSWFIGSREANVEPIFKSREVWSYQHIDPKTRRVTQKPVLIFRKASDGMFWGLPLTNVGREGKTLYVPRLKNGKKMPILSQMRTLKAERLMRRLGVAGEKEFAAVSSAVVRLLAQTALVQAPIRRERMYRVRSAPRSRPVMSPIYIAQPRYV